MFVLEIRQKYSVRKAILQHELINEVLKHRLHFKKGEETKINSWVYRRKPAPDQRGSQSKLPW